MDLKKIANRLSKTPNFVFCGESKVGTTKFMRNGLNESFPNLGKEYKISHLPLSKQIEISEKLLPMIKDRGDKSTSDETNGTISVFLENNIIFESISKAREFHVFNKNTRKVDLNFDPEIILRRMPKDKKSMIENNVKIAQLGYDAYNPEPTRLVYVNDIPVQQLNLYSPPKWRKEFPTPKPEWLDSPPELFKQFLDYLVPDVKEREEVLSWICWALSKRHHSYLVLRGSRGNGKTIFMKMIMGVVGDGYVALDGVMTAFNGDMKHKRLVGIDDDTEIGTYRGHKLRKKFINSRVTYQEKHIQTKESEEQYASYVICSNPSDQFYVEWDERRVVQVGLTDEKLEDMMSAKERNFLDTLADEESLNAKQVEFLAHLGHWLLEKAKSNHRSYIHCYKGGTFWEDVIRSLNGFNRRAVEMILNREQAEYSFEDLVFDWKDDKSNRQMTPSWAKFKADIESFRYMDENIIESVNNKRKTFKPIDKYCPDSLDDIDPMEVDI